MELRIRRFDKSLPLPEYKTRGAAAMDLSARIDVILEPGTVAAIPLNVAIEPPEGHFVLLAARSSLWKRGLTPINGIGIIDQDYFEEYQALVRNFTDAPVEVHRGDRIAQIIVLPYDHAVLAEVDHLTETERGMSGSTGI
jgi:dUTP pyrophosphatase